MKSTSKLKTYLLTSTKSHTRWAGEGMGWGGTTEALSKVQEVQQPKEVSLRPKGLLLEGPRTSLLPYPKNKAYFLTLLCSSSYSPSLPLYLLLPLLLTPFFTPTSGLPTSLLLYLLHPPSPSAQNQIRKPSISSQNPSLTD